MSDQLATIEPLDDKKSRYAALVKSRKACRLCSDVVNPSSVCGGRYDQHGHIGAWTNWQGNLDAEIMVIGQEWGGEDNFRQQVGRDKDSDPTNNNLVILMSMSMRLALSHPSIHQGRLDIGDFFFTNAALCLRKGAATSSQKDKNDLSKETFFNCGMKFLRPQVELVQPRAVLVLGKSAWEGLMNAFGLPFHGSHRLNFESGMVYLNKRTIAFPLFHCGAKAHLNRPIPLQQDDWNRVRELLHSIATTSE